MNPVRTTLQLVGALALFTLGGCASVVYEGKYPWSDGWRSAEVVAVQTAAEMERPRFHKCVRNASLEQLATTRFAVVKYRHMSRTQRRAIPLQSGQFFTPGDLVYVKVADCGAPVVPRQAGPRRSAAP
jgi:hypothetical protein